MGWSKLQSTSVEFANSTADRTLQYVSNVTSGTLLLVDVAYFGTPTLTVSADNGIGAFTQVPSSPGINGSNRIATFSAVCNTSGVKPIVTVSPGGTTAFITIAIFEYSGNAASTPADSTSTNTGSSLTATTGTCTASSGEMVHAASTGQFNNGTATVNAPFTLRENQTGVSNMPIATADDLNASGSEGCTFNWGGTGTPAYAAIATSWKVPAAATPAWGWDTESPRAIDAPTKVVSI